MESLKGSLTDLMAIFNERMSKFETELQKTPSASACTTTELAAEYNTFKTFVLEALGCLQRQMKVIARDVDALELHGRKKIVLMHGVPEHSKEETAQVVAEVVRNHLGLDNFAVSAVKRCHRMGRKADLSKPRPILVKFQDVAVRDKIWFAKTKFKGSGITVSEFLTRARHQVFLAAREKYGVMKCWTKYGHIFVLGSDGTRHRVASLGELDKIPIQVIQPKESKKLAVHVEPIVAGVEAKRRRPK